MTNKVAHDSAPALVVENVGIAYPRRRRMFHSTKIWALRNLSFELYHGETLGVVGKNGAGKSTLLKLLAGIVEPDEGKIHSNVSRVSLLALGVGFDKVLSGRENALLSGMLLGLRRSEMLQRIPDIIEFSGLNDSIDDPVNTYSAGMRARLGFSVSFHIDPDVLLIDEVLGVGDKDFKKISKQAMTERISADNTVVMVSHSNEIMSELCNRVLWIEKGELVQLGEAREVLGAYEKSGPGRASRR